MSFFTAVISGFQALHTFHKFYKGTKSIKSPSRFMRLPTDIVNSVTAASSLVQNEPLMKPDRLYLEEINEVDCKNSSEKREMVPIYVDENLDTATKKVKQRSNHIISMLEARDESTMEEIRKITFKDYLRKHFFGDAELDPLIGMPFKYDSNFLPLNKKYESLGAFYHDVSSEGPRLRITKDEINYLELPCYLKYAYEVSFNKLPSGYNENLQQSNEHLLYRALGLTPQSDTGQIKKAYHKLSMQYHPDKASEQQKKEHETLFQALSAAHEILADDNKRILYDRNNDEIIDVNSTLYVNEGSIALLHKFANLAARQNKPNMPQRESTVDID